MNVTGGATSVIKLVQILDTSKSAGEGLTGLTAATAGTLYYKRSNGSASVAVDITSDTLATLGTYAPTTNARGAFKKVDDTNMPGIYELHLPNNAFAAGARSVVFTLKGGTNAAPVSFEITIDEQTQLASNGLDAVSVSDTLAGSTLAGLTFRDRLILATNFLIGKRATDVGAKTITIYNNAGNAAKWTQGYTESSGVTTVALPT